MNFSCSYPPLHVLVSRNAPLLKHPCVNCLFGCIHSSTAQSFVCLHQACCKNTLHCCKNTFCSVCVRLLLLTLLLLANWLRRSLCHCLKSCKPRSRRPSVNSGVSLMGPEWLPSLFLPYARCKLVGAEHLQLVENASSSPSSFSSPSYSAEPF